MEQEHKRRVRYQGTHPRNFQEKYKELNPEKYRSDVEKIIQSGKTPAGMHIPIMVEEILDVLQIQPGRTFCKSGRGRSAMTPPWATAATPGKCWSGSRGKAISTPPTWTRWSRKRPGPGWRSWGTALRY